MIFRGYVKEREDQDQTQGEKQMSYRRSGLDKIALIRGMLVKKEPRTDIEAWELLISIKNVIGRLPTNIEETKEERSEFREFFGERISSGDYKYMDRMVMNSGLTRSEFLAKFKKAYGQTLKEYTTEGIINSKKQGIDIDKLSIYVTFMWNKDEFIVDPKKIYSSC